MPDDEGLREELNPCLQCGWKGTHAWLCPVRLTQPYSDGTTLWGPVCDCGSPMRPHRHGVSAATRALAADGTEPHPAHRHDETGAGR